MTKPLFTPEVQKTLLKGLGVEIEDLEGYIENGAICLTNRIVDHSKLMDYRSDIVKTVTGKNLRWIEESLAIDKDLPFKTTFFNWEFPLKMSKGHDKITVENTWVNLELTHENRDGYVKSLFFKLRSPSHENLPIISFSKIITPSSGLSYSIAEGILDIMFKYVQWYWGINIDKNIIQDLRISDYTFNGQAGDNKEYVWSIAVRETIVDDKIGRSYLFGLRVLTSADVGEEGSYEELDKKLLNLFGVSHNRELYQYTTNDPKVFEEALRMIREVC